jgi:hypothetical protein
MWLLSFREVLRASRKHGIAKSQIDRIAIDGAVLDDSHGAQAISETNCLVRDEGETTHSEWNLSAASWHQTRLIGCILTWEVAVIRGPPKDIGSREPAVASLRRLSFSARFASRS